MLDFTFYNPTKIVFGRGVHKEAGKYAAMHSKHVLLHYGGGSIMKNGVYNDVVASLNEAGVRFTELGGVQPNPRLSLVRRGIELCRENKIDFILAVGGGSVIDSAKAIAVGVPYDGDVWDFYTEKAEAEHALPVGTVLTIPAAGSESSPGSVVTNEDGLQKRAYNSDILFPKFSLLNPELCFTLPPSQIAAGGADIIAHVMERYFSDTPRADLSDRLCESTMRSIMATVPRALAEPQDYDAWADVMWNGTVAHNGILGKGRLEDWASHNIEHELSGLYDIAHGAGLAIIFPAWMKYVYKKHMNRFVQYAIRVFGVDLAQAEPERIALEGIRRTEEFFKSIGLVTKLSDVGIGSGDFEIMAQKACAFGPLGSLEILDSEDIIKIYELAL